MSEDSDEVYRFCEDPITRTSSSQPDSRPTSPVSPYRYQRPLTSTTSHHSSNSHTLPASMSTTSTTPQSRQRGSDTEGRFPSSPSDICHSSDLRRKALLRSVQMRTQPCGIASTSGTSNVDGGEERMCFKSMEEDIYVVECNEEHSIKALISLSVHLVVDPFIFNLMEDVSVKFLVCLIA
ncbi:uncharacterized protein LOC103829095 [Brassica rapa]|uniref:uncharacterized protein LOC103829095 n=1 Tax=Brassica campestris TaxID=3711 RepID=UPI00142D9BFA|nr:uncharacterized protein LOC103829095 [Brassica rapa]